MKFKKILAGVTVLTVAAALYTTSVNAYTQGKIAGFSNVRVNGYEYSAYEDLSADVMEAGDAGTYEGFEYIERVDGTLSIIGYSGEGGNIVIPAEIDGKNVSFISARAFVDCSSVVSIEIPASITTIYIDYTFKCSSLTSINVSEENPNYASVDGVLFNKDITEILCYPIGKQEKIYSIPDTVTRIGVQAFLGCDYLTTVDIPDSVTSISDSAFLNCTSLVEIEIPNSVTYIGRMAFVNCKAITDIKFPASVTSIAYQTFSGCSSLTTIEIPENVTSIGYYAFSECSSLTEIEIPSRVDRIERGTFSACSSLDAIKIPASVTRIEDFVFKGHPDDMIIYGYSDSYAEKYANENEINFSPIGFVRTDEETGVKIIADEGTVPEDVELKVKELENDEKSRTITFEISLSSADGKAIQPDGSVTVRIPWPSDWDVSNPPVINVYYRDGNGILTDMHAYYSGGSIVFTTTHFSEYIVTTQKLTTTIVGDVNNSGTVDDLDVVALARYLAGWNFTINEAAADVDGSGKVDDLDVVMLARRLAGWVV